MITTRLENAVKETKTLFGKRVRALRKNKGLSQEELAEKTDISSKYLSRVEMGQHFPSIDTLDKLANALKVDLKDFFMVDRCLYHPRFALSGFGLSCLTAASHLLPCL